MAITGTILFFHSQAWALISAADRNLGYAKLVCQDLRKDASVSGLVYKYKEIMLSLIVQIGY
jgi:hypothetical protein